jgi:ParB/RepB/Spo0J family partition protein
MMQRDRSIAMDQMDLRFLQLRSPTALAVRNMAHSMKKEGQLTPVVLAGDEKPYILIDGFKRYMAAQSLGWDSLNAFLIHVNITKAKVMIYLMNRTEGLSFIQEAMLVRELVEQDGLKQTEVARLLDHHKAWVNRRLMIIRRLSPEILQDFCLELLPKGSAADLSRVAERNQGDFSAVIQRHRLSPKEIHLLVDVWCKTSEPDKQQFLLRAPKEALSLLNKEQASLSALRKIRQLLSTVSDSNALRSCVAQIRSTIFAIEQALNKEVL